MARNLHTAVTALAVVSTFAVSAQEPLWTPAQGVSRDLLLWEEGQQRDAPSINRSEWVQLNADALRAIRHQRPGIARDFTLALPGHAVTVRIDEIEPTLGHHLFHGTIDGGTFLLALSDTDAAAAAEIYIGDEQFTLNSTFRDGFYVLRRHDWRPLGNRTEWSCGTNESHAIDAPDHGRLGGAGDPPILTNDDGTRLQVDVAVFWTNAARDAIGGSAAMQAETALRIGNANTACGRCNVDIKYRLTFNGAVPYAGGSSNDLSRFRSSTDGFIDGVHQKRAQYGADIMCLIVNNAAGYCGVGYLMRPSSPGFGSSAFNITLRTCLSNHTLTHEMGHNQGCHHDRANASTGAWPYSYGYRTPDNRYRSIMSYSPGQRINYWSSPLVSTRGYVFGTAGDDNSRGLNNSKNDIRRFYTTLSLNWCTLTGGIPGATGKPLLGGTGTTHPAIPVEVTSSNTVPGAPGVLVIGSHIDGTALFGGTLIPNIVITLPLAGSANDVVVDVSVLGSQATGADFYFQSWFLDATAVQGLSASDGLKVVVP